MKKKYAFIISFFITLIVAGNYLFFAAGEIFPEREKVVIERVIDGDTVELVDGRKIRLLNINTPEKGRAFSEESVNFLKKLEDKTAELEIEGIDIYGRILGRIYRDGYLNLEIVKLGLGHKYLVEDRELDDFQKAEEDARESELGIWKKSEHYGCLNVEINKNDEYVVIKSRCSINLDDWTLKDESTKNYLFGEIGADEFTFYSKKGINNEKELYWGRGKAWNDDKDSIFIRDNSGYLVYYDNYGY